MLERFIPSNVNMIVRQETEFKKRAEKIIIQHLKNGGLPHSLYHFLSRSLSENNRSELGTCRVLCGVLRVFIFIKHNSPGTAYPAGLIYKEKHFGWQGQFHFFSSPLTDKQINNLMKLPSQLGCLWMLWFESQIKLEQGGKVPFPSDWMVNHI